MEEVKPLLDENQREVAVSDIRKSIQRTHLLFHVDGLEKNPYVPDPFAPRLIFERQFLSCFHLHCYFSEDIKRSAKISNAYGDCFTANTNHDGIVQYTISYVRE